MNNGFEKNQALLTSELQAYMGYVNEQLAALQSQVNAIPTNSTPTQNPSAAVNQIRNGNHSHSVYTWEQAGGGTDAVYQDAWWYSHPIVDGQAMFKNNTYSGNASLTLGVVSGDNITITAHGLITGTACKVTGSIPAPLALATVYYVIVIDANTIQMASSWANAIAETQITLTDTVTGGSLRYNYALQNESSTVYSPTFSDWDWDTGSARFQGATDISCFLPGNNVEPGYTYYAVGSFVRLNQYIACDPSVRLFAGLYANSNALAGWDWVYGTFEISLDIVVPSGYTYVGGETYTYQIHTVTNREFTVNSSVKTTTDGPTLADFNAGCRVVLTWNKVLNFGVNSYNIYRTGGTPAANVRLYNVVNGTTYIDNNSFQETGTIPAADYDKLIAYTSTSAGIVATLPYQGDPLNPMWAVIPFAIKVPQNFDMSDAVIDDGFWLRFGFLNVTGNLDIDVDDGIIDETTTLRTASSGQFTADQIGCTVDIYIADDAIQSTTITAYTNANEVTIADAAVETDTNKRIYIHEGAPSHAISVDLQHLGFVSGAAYAPNSEDISPDRGTPAVTPNGTTQGGNGGGQPPNTPDGVPVCLFHEESVTMWDGTRKQAHELQLGDKLADGFGGWNTVAELQDGVSDVWLLTLSNGAEILATPTKQIYVGDGHKKPLSVLQKNDIVLTGAFGVKPEQTTVLSKEKIMKRALVKQIGLVPKHSFLAGGREQQVLVDNRKPGEIIITQ